MSDELYPDLQMAEMKVALTYSTEQVPFETGWLQRNSIWGYPRARFSLQYPILRPTEFDDLLNFFLRHKGAYETFFFQDFTDINPRSRVFGKGDGVTRFFRFQHDRNENPVVKVDGAAIAPVYVDPENGWVLFDTAPAHGTILTYNADNCAYRVHFVSDQLAYDRHQFIAYGGTVELERVFDQAYMYLIEQRCYGGALADRRLDAIDEAVAYSFTCPCAISVTSVNYYVSALTNPGTVRVSVYSDASGAPSAQLVTATHVPAGAGWQTVAVGTTSLVRNTHYWIVVEASSGTWDGTHHCDVQYTATVEDTIWEQDHLLYGGYISADRRCVNTPNSWLGVRERETGAAWGAHARGSHPAFFLNTAGTMVGHCQGILWGWVWGNLRTRQVMLANTTHDITIDWIATIVSTVAAPVDHLYYRIEFLSDPGVAQRSGTLAASAGFGGTRVCVEHALLSPLTIPIGETVYFDLYSPNSVAGAPWRHWGCLDGQGDYATGWIAAWDAVTWNGITQNRDESTDGGATWLGPYRGSWALRCRGLYEG